VDGGVVIRVDVRDRQDGKTRLVKGQHLSRC